MLELRPSCECCRCQLPNDALAAICSFECTFCAGCAFGHLNGVCPNCGGGFVPRPVRPPASLQQHPATTNRVENAPNTCPKPTPNTPVITTERLEL